MKIAAALMLKAPRPGFVKTRLAAEIGALRAAAVYRALAERQLGEIPAEWACAVHYSPDEAGEEIRQWLGPVAPLGTAYHPQGGGDLGGRMRHAVRSGLAAGAGAVVLLGGDCPGLGRSVLREVAVRIQTVDMAIGPAADGGYVLLALKQDCPALFEGIPWSTPEVLGLTLAAAAGAGLSVWRTRAFVDVDDAASLARVESVAGKPLPE